MNLNKRNYHFHLTIEEQLLRNSRFYKAVLWVIAIGLLLLIAAVILFYAGKGPKNPVASGPSRKVYIENYNGQYRFIKDGKPFVVKGGAGYTNLKQLAACGGNTIFCWDTTQIDNVLKEAAQYNVAVIIGLDIPSGDDDAFYSDAKNIAKYYNAYSRIVQRYKNHPMLLAWCLGNELSQPLTITNPPFYKIYNQLLAMFHNTDPDHPVSTSVINVPKRNLVNMQWRFPALDFICINTYNKLKAMESDLHSIRRFWNGPYLVGEWAPDGGWEAEITDWAAPIENTSTKKAKQFYDLYKHYMPMKDPRFLGSVAFYWGSRQEYTQTWFSIFSEENVPTEIAEVLNDCWKDTLTKHLSPKLKYMLVDSLGAADNIIVSAKSHHSAVIITDTADTSVIVRYKWEVVKEDWLTWGSTWRGFKRPLAEYGLLKDSTGKYSSFMAPSKPGPYRVFVTVYNAAGYCATANTPIYVTE